MKKLLPLLLIAAVMGACSPEYQTASQREIDRLTKGASFAMPKVKLPSFEKLAGAVRASAYLPVPCTAGPDGNCS